MVVLDRMNGEQFEGNGVPARDLRMWLVLGRKCLIQPPAILLHFLIHAFTDIACHLASHSNCFVFMLRVDSRSSGIAHEKKSVYVPSEYEVPGVFNVIPGDPCFAGFSLPQDDSSSASVTGPIVAIG
jgi:hypothetical protein